MAAGDKHEALMTQDLGAPDGVATLDEKGKLAAAQRPSASEFGAVPLDGSAEMTGQYLHLNQGYGYIATSENFIELNTRQVKHNNENLRSLTLYNSSANPLAHAVRLFDTTPEGTTIHDLLHTGNISTLMKPAEYDLPLATRADGTSAVESTDAVPAKYEKYPDGTVIISGIVRFKAQIETLEVIANLPYGCRPSSQKAILMISQEGVCAYAWARPNGQITMTGDGIPSGFGAAGTHAVFISAPFYGGS